MDKSVFEGVRVLDIGHIVAGPIAASVMADFGAEVIKIERPVTGDPLRWIYPKDGVGLFYKMEARNKKSITLDLKHPDGRDIFHRLVKLSDVVIENFRPSVMERLGSGWDTLSALNPKLILCRLSGFGQTGPYKDRRAYGRVGEAFGGFAHITGNPDDTPMHSHMSLGDTVAGVWSAMGVMMALYWRDAKGGGVGQVVDVGLYEGVFRQIEQHIILVDQLGKTLERAGNNHRNVPYTGLFKTKDGKYFSIAAVTQKSALDILRATGMDDDERFNTWERCLENRDLFADTMAGWMASHTLEEIDAKFQEQGAAASPVMSGADLIDNPHIKAREMVITVEDEDLGSIRMQGVVPKLSRTPGHVDHAGQRLGQSNELIYGELLGMSKARMQELRSNGVI